ncbi:hypothetical protein KBA73_04720 [Patescibacteria group bacterium]|nr:hypothetical protein [Patescibacteria group bacterium]
MFTLEEWQDEGRPGYLGAKRDARKRDWDEVYGAGGWTLGWRLKDNVFVDYLGACALYEDAYFAYLSAHPALVDTLVRRAANIYDVEPSDANSKLDYNMQQHGRTHIQDISIRRVLVRLGRWFEGPDLIQIRYHVHRPDKPPIDPLSVVLTPGKVPFHRLDLLETAPLEHAQEPWYDLTSVEAFYQLNKHLLIKK